jgi:hypothetical protein
LTCRAEADPPARFVWKSHMGYEMRTKDEIERGHGGSRGQSGRQRDAATVAENIWHLQNESMSVMQVLFSYRPPTSVGPMAHGQPPPQAPPTQTVQSPRYICETQNEIAKDNAVFDIRVGEGPITPEIHSYEYRDNILTIRLFPLGRVIHPPIDVYRLDFSGFYVYFNETHLENDTDTSMARHNVMTPGQGQHQMHGGQHPSQDVEPTPAHKKSNKQKKQPSRPTVTDARLNVYAVEAELPPGYHTVTLIAHNPIGWSHPRTAAERLQVSGAVAPTPLSLLSLLTSALMALCLALAL